jgi:hypothetical protein
MRPLSPGRAVLWKPEQSYAMQADTTDNLAWLLP